MITPEQRTELEETVKGPGKFEGEPLYVPHYWHMMLEGGCDYTLYGDIEYSCFSITSDDRADFPELEGVHTLILWEREDGFVCSRTTESEEKTNEVESSLEDPSDSWD